MKFRKIAVAVLLGSSVVTSAVAQHGSTRPSEASVGASVLGGLSVAWVAYEGSEFTVKALRQVGNGIELSLKGVSNGVETSALVAKDVSVGVGTSVTVVANSTGYALMAAGRMIAFVPNEVARSLLHHSRH
jgi:hypothetical protein